MVGLLAGDWRSGWKFNAGYMIGTIKGIIAGATNIGRCGICYCATIFGSAATGIIGSLKYSLGRISFRRVNGCTPSHLSSLKLCCRWWIKSLCLFR